MRRMRRFLGMGATGNRDDDRPKVKEADTIKVPAFPQAETHRNWRIKLRDAVVAASAKPGETFVWVSETWTDGQTIEALRKVQPFATLDAKLMSALTNTLTGEFARRVDTYKETEAAAGRIVRGRQVLWMIHDFFSTNIKHGATYALQDLFSVHLKGENLKTFITNWDQVLAGIRQVPDVSVLETLFYKQVKNCRAIAHDLNEYQRAAEGDAKRSYEFLIDSVRKHLDRERLEVNRERVARGLCGNPGKPSAPVAEAKPGYVPKGYCIQFARGKCTNDKCKYKHETPPPKSERKPSRSRGRSPSRSASPGGTNKKTCKFWKQGRCNKGDSCKFSHDGKAGKPRKATPARSGSRDSSGKRKPSKSPKRNKSKSPGRSKSPKGSRSPRDKKGNPAAVCLIASMLASVSQAMIVDEPSVCCPSVSFSNKVNVTKFKAQGDLWPVIQPGPKNRTTYPWGHVFDVDMSLVDDAITVGRMLEGAVANQLKGIPAKCDYNCDTEFGCDFCIPKDIVAVPAASRKEVKNSARIKVDWIADTGRSQDLVPDDYGYYSDNPIRMITANGENSSDKQGKVYVPQLGMTVDPYLVPSTPAVLSVGMRCVRDGFDFVWKGSLKEDPYFVKPNGERIDLTVKDYVPYITEKPGVVCAPSAKRVSRVGEEPAPSSPDT